ncbi:hypothetical protein K525DRAFT_275108 [Schizophyllum commune Loenen D]|nr:hypothetical protein K525DRAFT_275108 [Schizophyllum commune Loenen D]
MAWSSPGGGQYPAWHTSSEPFAPHPIAARQSPGDRQEYAYSRTSYTNNGSYVLPTATHFSVPPYSHHPEHASLQARQEHEAREASRAQRAVYLPPPAIDPTLSSHSSSTWMHPDIAARQCEYAAWEAAHAPHPPVSAVYSHPRISLPPPPRQEAFIEQHRQPSDRRTHHLPPPSPPTAQATAGYARTEEATRPFTLATAEPPARPARSASRTQPMPIPPPLARPRIDTRNDARAWDALPAATWQGTSSTQSPQPSTRPPPRPARAATRRPSTPTRHDHPPDTPPCAMSARATSLGDADRTAPTNDRPSSPSRSTATAPPTRLVPSPAASTRSQDLPSRPSRLYGPSTPPTNPIRRVSQTDPGDVLQDAAYLRAIEDYAQEGGERRKRARGDEGKDALARSVRGTHSSVSHTSNCDISCVSASLRAPGTPAMAISRATDTATRDEHESASPAVHHLIRMDERQRAPSAPVSTASRVTTRGQDGHTTTTISCRPPRSIVVPPPLPPSLLHRHHGTNDGTRESKYSRGMAIPSPREATTTQSDRARPALPPTPCNRPPKVPSHSVDRDFSRDLTLSRAGQTPTLEISTPAVAIEDGHRSGRERATPVPAPPPRHIDARREGRDSSTPREAYANGSRVMFSSERGVAHAKPIAASSSTVLAPPSSRSESPLVVHPLQQPPADVRAPPPRPGRAAARSSDARTGQAVSAQEHAINNASPTRRGARPSSFLPHVRAATHQSPALTTLPTGRHARMEDFASLGTAESCKEYTGADGVRLAGAPAQGRGQGPSLAHCVAHRADSPCLHTTAAAHPRQVSLRPSPRSIIQPPPLRPAPLKHPTPTFPSHLIPVEVRVPPPSPTGSRAAVSGSTLPAGRAQGSARTALPLVDARLHEEHTRADIVRLARAPIIDGHTHNVAASVNGRTSFADPQRVPHAPWLAYSTSPTPATSLCNVSAPKGVPIHAIKHPPPPPPLMPPPLPLRPPATPPGWPFPISIEEMGWVLTAVVMARRMDQEDEQRQREDEYDYDYDHFDLQRDETDTGMAYDLERGASSPKLSTHGGDVFGSDTMATLDQQDEYADSFNPASSVSSPVASIDIEHDDADAWGSEEASLHLSDQLDEDFNSSDWSEDQYWEDEVVGDV